jgi:hypothetical protein
MKRTIKFVLLTMLFSAFAVAMAFAAALHNHLVVTR